MKVLRCVEFASGVAVKCRDSVFVSDHSTNNVHDLSTPVCLVRVSQDSIIMKLQTPHHFKYRKPGRLVTMGSTFLVCFEYISFGSTGFVLYHGDDPIPTRVLDQSDGLTNALAITT